MNAHRILISAAAVGIMLGASSCSDDRPDGSSSTTPATDSVEKHACKGMNSCKGKGGCKTEAHACKGMNACKGQGGCKTA